MGIPSIRLSITGGVVLALLFVPNINVFKAYSTLKEEGYTQQNIQAMEEGYKEVEDELNLLKTSFDSERTSTLNYYDAEAIINHLSKCDYIVKIDATALQFTNTVMIELEYYLTLNDCDGAILTLTCTDVEKTLEYIDSMNLLVYRVDIVDNIVSMYVAIKEVA